MKIKYKIHTIGIGRKTNKRLEGVLCILTMYWLHFVSANTLLKGCVFDVFLDFGSFEQLCQPAAR